VRDSGIASTTNGLARVRVLSAKKQAAGTIEHSGEFLFYFILRGELGLHNERFGSHRLVENESCVIPAGAKFGIDAAAGTEILEVALPAS
jgi:mannose-6-phosphate isomerase-like protein (cupin superfamily)